MHHLDAVRLLYYFIVAYDVITVHGAQLYDPVDAYGYLTCAV